MIRIVTVLAMALLAGIPARAQEFWEKKPYTEWSKQECERLLRDSPWAKTFTISAVRQDRFGQPTKGESRQTEQRIFYYAQLRSALPVRQAVVRLSQIEGKYDKMSTADKQAFDQSANRYLNAQYPEIVVHIDYSSDVEFFDKELANHWQSRQPQEMINSNVYLTTSRGTRVSPISFTAPRGAARAFEFVFPRLHNGEPLITANVESIRIEFPNPQIRELNDQRTTFEFRTDKMKYKGAIIY